MYKTKDDGKGHTKKTKAIVIMVASALLLYIGFVIYINRPITATVELSEIRVSDIPLVAHDTPAPSFNLRSIDTLPSSDGSGVRDLRFFDLSNAKLLDNVAELGQATFSSNTVWPASIPNNFSPEEILSLGKNPGLGVRALHERGITGEGVGIAIIDFNILLSHEQYASNLRLYELYRTVNRTAVMHGPAVVAVAVGENTGVAPKADLFFIATMWGVYLPPFAIPGYSRIVSSIDRILEINNYLPEFVPTDSRTTASHTGDSDYIFLRRGGNSLAAPWLAGLYALCVQVYPNISPDIFITLAFETGDILHRNDYTLGTIVNPIRLIEALESISKGR